MRAEAAITLGVFWPISCLLFFVAAIVAAVGAVASSGANQGSMRVDNALQATIIVVTNTNDNGPGSLRDALAIANDGDTIDATGVSGTILLTSGELPINHNVTINGPGAGNLAVDGNHSSPVFGTGGSGATISGLTITNGFGAGIENGPGGVLTVDNCTVSGNSGSGISNQSGDICCATLTVSNSTINANSGDYGGGILNTNGSFATVSNSTITNNSATVGGGGIANASSEASTSVTINNSTLSGNSSLGNGGGIFNIAADAAHVTLLISNSIISHNSANNGGGISNEGRGEMTIDGGSVLNNAGEFLGGAIASNGDRILTVTNSVISGNVSGRIDIGPGGGGGVYVFAGRGIVRITNSVISGNGTTGTGGGMAAEDGVRVMITDTTISDNAASNPNLLFTSGGGVACAGPLTVMNSTITDNSAGLGGGLVTGALTVVNSTISGNVASSTLGGGGIYCSGLATLTNNTISGNVAEKGDGGAIHNFGTMQIGDTVLNAGPSGGTIFNDGGTVTSLGYNIASDNGGGVLLGPGDRINTNPMLGPLQDNGGPTFTHELLPGSPAIDAGDPSFTPPPAYDQRGLGFFRVRNGRIDVGSFEVQAGSTPTPTPTATPTATATLTPRPTPTPRPRPTPHPRPALLSTHNNQNEKAAV
jgi:hypothetical protein